MTKEELAGVIRAFASAAIAYAAGKGWLNGLDPVAQGALAGAVATVIAAWSVKAKRA
ncbi:MAG: hypothetical protein RL758_644 [Pseudomonadota bacterium]|jgi:hypothetical protein